MSNLLICKFRKSMVIHDTECPYWNQVLLNNTTQTKPNLLWPFQPMHVCDSVSQGSIWWTKCNWIIDWLIDWLFLTWLHGPSSHIVHSSVSHGSIWWGLCPTHSLSLGHDTGRVRLPRPHEDEHWNTQYITIFYVWALLYTEQKHPFSNYTKSSLQFNYTNPGS